MLTPLLYAAAKMGFNDFVEGTVGNAFACSVVGLWGGLIIGAQTE